MFTIDPKITDMQLLEKKLFKVLFSMNSHQVATPETSLEDARSYVFFSREGKNRLSAYIGLHLLLTDRKIFYAHPANPFLEEELMEIEEEARNFAEDLGAMLDEVDFENMSDVDQKHWIDDQSIFSRRKQPEPAPLEQPVPSEIAAVAAEVQPPATPEQPEPAAEVVPSKPPEAPEKPEPAAEVVPPKPPEAPEQPVPAAEVIRAPQSPAAPVQPVTQPAYPEAPQHPLEAPVMESVQQDVQAKAASLAAVKRRQELKQRAASNGIDMSPKQTAIKKSLSATGVVGRDREALARLLTSF